MGIYLLHRFWQDVLRWPKVGRIILTSSINCFRLFLSTLIQYQICREYSNSSFSLRFTILQEGAKIAVDFYCKSSEIFHKEETNKMKPLFFSRGRSTSKLFLFHFCSTLILSSRWSLTDKFEGWLNTGGDSRWWRIDQGSHIFEAVVGSSVHNF